MGMLDDDLQEGYQQTMMISQKRGISYEDARNAVITGDYCEECNGTGWRGSQGGDTCGYCNGTGKPQEATVNSVLQDWVMRLPLRAQGTLLTGVRGCDLAPKVLDCIDEKYGCSTGEGSAERQLVAFLRFCFMNPADPREVDIPGAFFQSKPPTKWKPSQFGHYPQHWYAHIMHCFEVVGYYHPKKDIADQALGIYFRLVSNLHLKSETMKEMIERLTEDRISTNTVVS